VRLFLKDLGSWYSWQAARGRRSSQGCLNSGPKPGLWIRIRIGSGFNDFVDPDPWARKIKKSALFLYFLNIFIAKR
jgi:hypothetical protein